MDRRHIRRREGQNGQGNGLKTSLPSRRRSGVCESRSKKRHFRRDEGRRLGSRSKSVISGARKVLTAARSMGSDVKMAANQPGIHIPSAANRRPAETSRCLPPRKADLNVSSAASQRHACLRHDVIIYVISAATGHPSEVWSRRPQRRPGLKVAWAAGSRGLAVVSAAT